MPPAVGGAEVNVQGAGDIAERPAVLERLRLVKPLAPLVQSVQWRASQGGERLAARLAAIALQSAGVAVPSHMF